MSKGVGAGGGGGVGGGGGGGGSGSFAGAAAVVAGPTVSAAAQAAQRQRSLLQRADADIGSLLDNFSHLLKAARVLISTPPPRFVLSLSFRKTPSLSKPAQWFPFLCIRVTCGGYRFYQKTNIPKKCKAFCFKMFSLAMMMAAREVIDAVC